MADQPTTVIGTRGQFQTRARASPFIRSALAKLGLQQMELVSEPEFIAAMQLRGVSTQQGRRLSTRGEIHLPTGLTTFTRGGSIPAGDIIQHEAVHRGTQMLGEPAREEIAREMDRRTATSAEQRAEAERWLAFWVKNPKDRASVNLWGSMLEAMAKLRLRQQP